MEDLINCPSCCLFCFQSVEETGHGKNGDLLDRQVDVVFIVRKLLSLSTGECEVLLTKFGSPSTWLEMCKVCGEIVMKARRVFEGICALEKELEERRQEARRKIRDTEFGNCGNGLGMSGAAVAIRDLVLGQNVVTEVGGDWKLNVKTEKWEVDAGPEEDYFLNDPLENLECTLLNDDNENTEDDNDRRSRQSLNVKRTKKKVKTTKRKNSNGKIGIVKCEYCVLKFKDRVRLSSHIRDVHWIYQPEIEAGGLKNPSVLRRGRKCKKCDKRLPLEALRKHCLQEHGMFPCSRCPRLFESHNSRSQHLTRLHNVPRSKQPLRYRPMTEVPKDEKDEMQIIEDSPVVVESEDFEKKPDPDRLNKKTNKKAKAEENKKKVEQRKKKKVQGIKRKYESRKKKLEKQRIDSLSNITDVRVRIHKCLFCSCRIYSKKATAEKHMHAKHKDQYMEYLQRKEDESTKLALNVTTIEREVDSIKVHQCRHCNYCNPSRSGVIKHMLSMHKDLYYHVNSSKEDDSTDSTVFMQCEKCPPSEENKFKSVDELNNHKVTVHNMVRCEKCPYVCLGLGYLENHQIAYHSEQTSDPSCWISETTPNGRRIKPALSKGKKKPPQPPQCKLCQEVFSTRGQLTEHNLKKHPDEMFKCEKCPKIFDKLVNLYLHKTEVHNEPDDPYRCPECNYSSKRFRLVHVHRQRVHGDSLRVVCEICSDSFATERYLDCHKAQKHGIQTETTLTCTQCSKTFSTPTYLKTHFKTVHLGCWRYKCPRPDCGIGFMSQKQVDHHINAVHDKILPFVCTVEGCPKKFAGGWQLKNHMKRAHGPREFRCSLCSYAAVDQRTLKIHIKEVHDKSNSFQCDFCGKVYTMKRNLQQHLRMTHKISSKIKGKKANLTPFVASINDAKNNSKSEEAPELKTNSTSD